MGVRTNIDRSRCGNSGGMKRSSRRPKFLRDAKLLCDFNRLVDQDWNLDRRSQSSHKSVDSAQPFCQPRPEWGPSLRTVRWGRQWPPGEMAAMPALTAYTTLLFVAFGAATLLPLQSEAVFAGLLGAGGFSPLLLLAVASIGNVAGSSLNWVLGRFLERYRGHRWFPVKETALARAQGHYQRYGKWSLLLSWMPIVGDPLTVVAGLMREPFHVFLALVAVAKIARYLAIMALVMQFVP